MWPVWFQYYGFVDYMYVNSVETVVGRLLGFTTTTSRQTADLQPVAAAFVIRSAVGASPSRR